MLRFNDAPKKATNLTLNAHVLQMAREMGMNISQTVDALLAQEVQRRYWEHWNAQNKAGVEAYNQRVQTHGLPLAGYRSWGRTLGTGKEGNKHGPV